jgi:hypothetical protein
MKRGPHSAPGTHPGAGTLLDWLEGRLDVSQRHDVSSHLDRCSPCRSEADAWRSVLDGMRQESRDPVPAFLHNWAAALASRDAGAFPRRAALLDIITDSWGALREAASGLISSPSLLPALRSENGSAPRLGRRRILFSSSAFDLDLEIDYSGEQDPRRIHGQLLPVDGGRGPWFDAEIRLVGGRHPAERTRLDRRGEFSLTRVRPGRYRIEVQGPVCCASPTIEV